MELYIKDRLAHKDYAAVLALLYIVNDLKEKEFQAECLKRFKSHALCVTNTKPFFIWQKIEIERLRKSIFV